MQQQVYNTAREQQENDKMYSKRTAREQQVYKYHLINTFQLIKNTKYLSLHYFFSKSMSTIFFQIFNSKNTGLNSWRS